jgi:serine O-acetyltransferase
MGVPVVQRRPRSINCQVANLWGSDKTGNSEVDRLGIGRQTGRRDRSIPAVPEEHNRTRRAHLRPQERLVTRMRNPSTRRLAYKGLKLLGVEIPPSVEIGDNFQLAHGAVGLVIHEATKIGNNVKVFQGVTLGFADEHLPAEEISAHLDATETLGQILVEDDVVIGAGAKLIFKLGQTLTVGRGAVIGANAVVLSSVPPGEIWAGVPARRVGTRCSW